MRARSRGDGPRVAGTGDRHGWKDASPARKPASGAACFPVFQALICCWPPVPDVTSIFRGWAFSATGIRTVRTPPS